MEMKRRLKQLKIQVREEGKWVSREIFEENVKQ